MKEDYLWDKTGNDPEIENMENALKTFRQKDSTPPEIPANTFAFDKNTLQNEKPRRFFQFAFAAFASLVFVFVAVGVFQFTNGEKNEFAQNSPNQNPNKILSETSASNEKEVSTEKTLKQEKPIESKNEKTILIPKRKTIRQFAKNRRKFTKRTINKKSFAKRIKAKPLKREPTTNSIRLTKEEKDAYDQLMKALAITGSQLRKARSKIRGEEEKSVAEKDGR